MNIKSSSGVAKLAGVVVCLGGAATLAFYKGPQFSLWPHHLLHQTPYQSHVSSGKTWIKGCFLMLSSNTLWAFWLVLQVTHILHLCHIAETQFGCGPLIYKSFVPDSEWTRIWLDWVLEEFIYAFFFLFLLGGTGKSYEELPIEASPHKPAMFPQLDTVTPHCNSFCSRPKRLDARVEHQTHLCGLLCN